MSLLNDVFAISIICEIKHLAQRLSELLYLLITQVVVPDDEVLFDQFGFDTEFRGLNFQRLFRLCLHMLNQGSLL